MAHTYIESKDTRLIVSFFEKKFPDGIFTANQVLDLARPKNSPIHKYFNWDDTDAAEKYRLYQARHLISCVVVEIDNKKVRKYITPVRVEHLDRTAYVEVNKARNTPDIWSQVLDRAMKDALLWEARYKNLVELTPIHNAIRKTNHKLSKGKKNA